MLSIVSRWHFIPSLRYSLLFGVLSAAAMVVGYALQTSSEPAGSADPSVRTVAVDGGAVHWCAVPADSPQSHSAGHPVVPKGDIVDAPAPATVNSAGRMLEQKAEQGLAFPRRELVDVRRKPFIDEEPLAAAPGWCAPPDDSPADASRPHARRRSLNAASFCQRSGGNDFAIECVA